jgi:hypothetical protein
MPTNLHKGSADAQATLDYQAVVDLLLASTGRRPLDDDERRFVASCLAEGVRPHTARDRVLRRRRRG